MGKSDGTKDRFLGIELPFDWCLVRGAELRKLQSDLRQARFESALRSRICGYLLKQIYRKDAR